MVINGLGLLARGWEEKEKKAKEMGRNYPIDLSRTGWILWILSNKIQLKFICKK